MINVEGDIVVSFSSNDSGKLILMLVINDGIPSTLKPLILFLHRQKNIGVHWSIFQS